MSVELITETTRLLIVKIDEGDAALLYQLTGDSQVMRYFPSTLSYKETKQLIDEILSHYRQYGYCFWKLLLKTTKEFIGVAGLLHQEIDGNAETEIAFRIKPEHWNNGYATEAAQACKDYAEEVLHKKRLISLIRSANNASRRVAEKLSARKEKQTIFMGLEHEVYVY